MPNPKTGTVTPDVTKAVNDIKGGKINFRVDKAANLHFVIGKASFDPAKLAENYGAAYDEILRSKPSAAKGRYLKKVTITTTTGPGIPVDPAVSRNFALGPTPDQGSNARTDRPSDQLSGADRHSGRCLLPVGSTGATPACGVSTR